MLTVSFQCVRIYVNIFFKCDVTQALFLFSFRPIGESVDSRKVKIRNLPRKKKVEPSQEPEAAATANPPSAV